MSAEIERLSALRVRDRGRGGGLADGPLVRVKGMADWGEVCIASNLTICDI